MIKNKYSRAAWFLGFMQAELPPETSEKMARELAYLLLVYDLSAGPGVDDQRVSLALQLAAMTADADMVNTVASIQPRLAEIKKILELQLRLLLIGQEVVVDVPTKFKLRLNSPDSELRGGLSCPVYADGGEYFALIMNIDAGDLVQHVLLNFSIALGGMSREDLGRCPECGTYFVVARRGNVFCSPKCASAHGARSKRQQVRGNPAAHEKYLEAERERKHQKYREKVKSASGGKAERRPRKSKVKED